MRDVASAKNFGDAYFESMPTVGHAMAMVLSWFDCRDVYGVGGDYAAPLVRALDPHLTLRPSPCEVNAAFSACGAAEAGGMGACLVTYTVGSLPCLSAAALAIAERLPVIFLSGAPAESEQHLAGLHHTLIRADSWRPAWDNALLAFSALGMRAERLAGARNEWQPNIAGEQFYELVEHAYLRRAPVFVEVPRDIVPQKTQTLKLPSDPRVLPERPSHLDGAAFIADHIERKLRACKKPLVYHGEKVRHNRDLQDAMLSFCRRHSIPFAGNICSKGVFDDEDPLSLGIYNGVFSRQTVREYVEREVDFVLEVGTSTYSQDVSSALHTGTNVIDHHPNKVAIIGTSMREVDEVHLFRMLAGRELPSFSFLKAPAPEPPRVPDDVPVEWDNVMALIDGAARESARAPIFLPEIGTAFFTSFSLPMRRSKLGRSFLANPWYGSMGTALPYARATCHVLARLGSDDIPVVLIGDGGFHFQSNELVQFQREGLDVVIILFRNDVFHLGRSSASPLYEASSADFDACRLVSAYGGTGVTCRLAGEFRAHLREALAAPGKTGIRLIEVRVSVDEAHQSDEVRMINTYIRSKAGIEPAVSEWDAISRSR